MKTILKAALGSLGLELRRTRPAGAAFPADPYLAQRELLTGSGRTTPVIFDVGAHHGETVARYRSLFPAAVLHAFEPYPASYESLQRRFGKQPGVHLVAAAVAARSGTTALHVNRDDATHSLHPRSVDGRRYYHSAAGAVGSVDVTTVSLDDYCARNGIPRIDILKLDIQGGELLALEGARELLREQRVAVLYTEAFAIPHYAGAPLLHDLWRYLAALGYTLFDLYDPFHARNGQLRFLDALFVAGSVRAGVVDRYPEEP